MLINYLKLAIKVLARKKFYTFISLFGISFTLMILMTLAAFLDNELGNHAPVSEGERMVFLPRVTMSMVYPDTSYTIDTTMVNGVETYDSTMNINENNRSVSTSSASYTFLDKYMRDLPYVENYSFYSQGHNFDVFLNNQKLNLSALYTDARYWEIFDFHFIEGGPYRVQSVQQQALQIVISEKARRAYFGTGVNAVNQEIFMDDKHFQVVGVVENSPQSTSALSVDVFIPYTHMRPDLLKTEDFLGTFDGVFLCEKASDKTKLESEVHRKAEVIPLPNPDEYNILELNMLDRTERYAVSMLGMPDDKKQAMRYFSIILIGMISLFILLPTLNLINVNTTRIMERASEIGVRKAFGARTSDLLLQFVFENIILTFIGGLIGCLLSLALINWVNESQFMEQLTLHFNTSVFLYSLLICLVFGIISGFLPAWRMSKLPIVKALKEQLL